MTMYEISRTLSIIELLDGLMTLLSAFVCRSRRASDQVIRGRGVTSAKPGRFESQLCAVRIFVHDLNRALQFYHSVLGLELTADTREQGCVKLEVAPSVFLILEQVDEADQQRLGLVGRFSGVSFAVQNLQETYQKLHEATIPVAGPPEKHGEITSIIAFDPDGNSIVLVQHQAEPGEIDAVVVTVSEVEIDGHSASPGSRDPFMNAHERAMETFNNIEQKVSQMEAQVAAIDKERTRREERAAEDARLIEEELAELKKKTGLGSSSQPLETGKPRLVVSGDEHGEGEQSLLPAVIDDSIDNLPATIDEKESDKE